MVSVLNIPGGKSRGIQVLEGFLPPDTTEIYSPFFGGGAFEIYCAANKNIRVVACDKFKPLANFWQCFLKNKQRVIDGIQKLLPMSKESFVNNKTVYHKLKSKYAQAAMYFAINRVSFNGVMQKYSHVRAMRSSDFVLKKLAKFNVNNINVKHQDYIEFLSELPEFKNGMLLFLDPPYRLKEFYYGWRGEMHRGFDHVDLAARLLAITDTFPWILCYNDCAEIRQLYNNCAIYTVSWVHSMSFSNNKQENRLQNNTEIVILSHKLNATLMH